MFPSITMSETNRIFLQSAPTIHSHLLAISAFSSMINCRGDGGMSPLGNEYKVVQSINSRLTKEVNSVSEGKVLNLGQSINLILRRLGIGDDKFHSSRLPMSSNVSISNERKNESSDFNGSMEWKPTYAIPSKFWT